MGGWRKLNKGNFINCIKCCRCAHIKDDYIGVAFSSLLTDFVVTSERKGQLGRPRRRCGSLL